MNKTSQERSKLITVVYHSADFDGIFCREIARAFLGESGVTYIGWNFGDPPIAQIDADECYILDLPCDAPFGTVGKMPIMSHCDLVWIDHHKSSIESHPKDIVGYRIDGVAACRLTWQWFSAIQKRGDGADYPTEGDLPPKLAFVQRRVSEPWAVRLAGEYDIWDKRDPNAELFQYGLRSCKLEDEQWEMLLSSDTLVVNDMLDRGMAAQTYAKTVDANNMKASLLITWQGQKFLCLNGRGNSLTFESRDHKDTGHDALLMFYFNGTKWVVSLYHAKHNTDLDLSIIAKGMGGGGHRGACGFTCNILPWI